ncbi:nucleotide exchange factor GrpE [Desulfobulbus sp.]|uniref:nucleotide exchange factor GrpE n=1 Tax=Desulfobulbus sp. TaxID=895 RepID=UPI00286F594F|nr:nucleotide exchange factor GrpE [Desulfobulbus sp.]
MAEEAKEQEVGKQDETDAVENPEEAVIVEEAAMDRECETETLQRELADARDQMMRIAAEFDNFKKRAERERGKLLKYAGENILRDLLTTVDNLDRAIEQGGAAAEDEGKKLQAMVQGVELTRKGLVATLERFGVEPLEAVGLPFNPDEHDALTMEASADVAANHVLREFLRGYRFKDRILRHAQVVVSSGPEKSA